MKHNIAIFGIIVQLAGLIYEMGMGLLELILIWSGKFIVFSGEGGFFTVNDFLQSVWHEIIYIFREKNIDKIEII